MNRPRRMGTVGRALDDAAVAIGNVGIRTARLDAQVILSHVLGRDPAWLIGHADDTLDAKMAGAFASLINRRSKLEPVAYIVGQREFWSLMFRVTPETLIPRPDSETLVEASLIALQSDRLIDAPQLLDLGTGTGCLLLALLHEIPAASGVGLDRSPGAGKVALENAQRLGLTARSSFVIGSWTDEKVAAELDTYDLVISNPPYISETEMLVLDGDVRLYEPPSALFAGPDGLDAYRELLDFLPSVLKPGGIFVGEFGELQATPIVKMFSARGLTRSKVCSDAAGRERCVVVHWDY